MNEFIEIENPYSPLTPVSKDFLFHDDVIRQIKERFDTHPEYKCVVLQGNPGVGKTIMLKYIEKHPELLGKKYIPIYLDSQKYIGFDSDDLSVALYKDIVEELIKRGYPIPRPNFFHDRRTKDWMIILTQIFLIVDTYLFNNETITIIFDEFDKLLEHTDVNSISEIIKYFDTIEKNWNRYSLILAGNKNLIDLIGDVIIKRFLNTTFPIHIKDVLSEETMEKFISEPVKNQLTYDPDSIKKITWYSGKNWYAQQLICHYLVKRLNKEKRNHCKIDDVERTIRDLLNEKIKEFSHAWENTLSLEAKLIVSALADESITEKRGNLYFLKDNNMLFSIFRDSLDDELKKLYHFGFIIEIRDRQLYENPFKIPLYGLWIKQEHPFIKTVLENMEHIADKIDTNVMLENLNHTAPENISPFDKEKIVTILKKWNTVYNNIVMGHCPVNTIHIDLFFNDFCALLGLLIKREAVQNDFYAIIDIIKLKIGVLEEALCFIQDKPELSGEEIAIIERRADDFAQHSKNGLNLFFYFKPIDKIEELVKKTYLNFIAVDENEMKKIIFSLNPLEALRKIILNKLSLQRISPYKTDGPAKLTFYGRSNIINQLTQSSDSSFAIVGARKIGKSSLLLRIKETPPPGVLYIYMYLESDFTDAKSYRPFLKSLESELEYTFNKKINLTGLPFLTDLSKLPWVIHSLSGEGKKIVLIFDEIDGLLAFDKKHNYKLTHQFRAMSQKNYCQFVFTGFKELYLRKRYIDNPLYNFCQEILLTPLEKDAALDLITKPMESIGIHYHHTDDRELILGYTACHPSLLQFFCKKLIEKIEKHRIIGQRRTIFKEDIDQVYDNDYEQYIMDQVYMFKSLGDIERLILILMADEPANEKTFREEEIRDKLIKNGITLSRDSINKHLKNLVMQFILVDEDKDNYRIALPVFPEMLKKRIDKEYKNKILKELKQHV